ncbi:Cysteine-rich receptor protein [Heracleum sosnowskyi]|uniref:Cysteine-rich receptor protein n=1 Tax=Heracleum sosnowskyi TaxID=360622 RepID=A0AAD8NAH1_9APIA|nr:Cysteine-rich receptor protein [Heracleum sosnowskyi]
MANWRRLSHFQVITCTFILVTTAYLQAETMKRWWGMILAVVTLALVFESVMSQQQNDDPLNSGCSQYNATNTLEFFRNLNTTLADLRRGITVNKTYFGTQQQARTTNPVYTMFQCRKYLSTADCVSCFDKAAIDIRRICRLANGARVIYDNCFLRYESNGFYSTATALGNTGRCNNDTITNSTASNFNLAAGEVLSNLLIATPKNCMNVAYENIKSCPPRSGARAIDAGCFMRYANTPFFASNQTTNLKKYLKGGGSSNKKAIIGGIAGGVGLLLILLALLSWYLLSRKKKVAQRGHILGSTELQGPVTYNYKELKSATKNFSEEYKLGEGGSGDVYKGIVKNGNIVAVKRLALSTTKAKASFESEVRLISNVHHRNLVRLLGCSSKGPDLLLVYEYMENGSLDRFLYGGKRGTLNWKQRFDIIFGTARGLAYLHEQFHVRIIHRDIKPGNILLDDELQPKIADFGLARLLPEDQSHLNTKFAGTLGYTAPEYALQGQLSEKVDTYSFGVVVLEIVSGRRCSDTNIESDTDFLLEYAWKLHENGMHLKLVDDTLDPNDYTTEDAKKIIEIALMCTQSPASLRPTMSEVVVLLLSDDRSLEQRPLSKPTFVHSENRIRDDSSTPPQSISNATATLSDFVGR